MLEQHGYGLWVVIADPVRAGCHREVSRVKNGRGGVGQRLGGFRWGQVADVAIQRPSGVRVVAFAVVVEPQVKGGFGGQEIAVLLPVCGAVEI